MGQIPSYFYPEGGMWDGTNTVYNPVTMTYNAVGWLNCGICWARVQLTKTPQHSAWHNSVVVSGDLAYLVKAEVEKLMSTVDPTLKQIEAMLKQIET